VPSRTRVFSAAHVLFIAVFFLMVPALGVAEDVWDAPAFSSSPEALRLAAGSIKPDKYAYATMLLNDIRFTYDAQGRAVQIWHRIYRIENEVGVTNWAEVRSSWEPWHQSKPDIQARVIVADGAVHQLDPKTLNDVPVHEDEPDIYSDAREFGGPLPAIAIGAIVEEEITLRDTSASFSDGTVVRYTLAKDFPVTKTRFVISHPESLPLHYVLHKAPAATIKKSTENHVETITIENGPFEAFTEDVSYLSGDIVPASQIEFSTGVSWQQVAAEYSRLTNGKLRVEDVQPLVARAGISNLKNRIDVSRRLIQTLHKSVRYTGVEFGESSLVPQFPAETLKRKYGDCKDKAALLVTMLHAAGIPAHLALLSTGPGRDINPQLPGVGLFDHAIVYVPASGADPELWIDATAQYSQIGVLPKMDYGRLALIVDEKTTELKKIPELTSSQNVHRETREFTLAEYGPARIIETDSQEGPADANYRSFYSADTKKLHEDSEKYVKNTYLADSLGSFEKGDASNLEKPFVVTFTAQGRRGSSDRENAVVYIHPARLMDGFPDYFETREEPQKEEPADKETTVPKKTRKFDWQLSPFVNEWHYKIIAPPGFKLRALPASKDEDLASAHYSQKFTVNADGTVVEAAMRFDSGKARLTVEEGRKLRDAIVKMIEAEGVLVTFDEVGYALLKQGKVKESLAAYQQLATLHPKEALHKTQLAYAYLEAGLGDRARAVAKEATVLEPNSADAFSALGWIMQHDQIGRRFGKGFDYKAALDAYSKAHQLDPKETNPQDKNIQINYAVLLEYDENGERYTEKSHMEQAIAEFNDVKKRDEETGKRYDDNVLYDLWYLHKYKELQEQASALPASDVRRGLILAAVVADQGVDAAIKKSMELTSSEQERSSAASTAGWLLVRVRKYQESAQMFSMASGNQNNSGQFAAFVNALKNTKPYEKIKMDSSDPRSVIQNILVSSLFGERNYDKVLANFSKRAIKSLDTAEEREKFSVVFTVIRNQAEKSGLTPIALSEIALSSARYSVEGSESLGFKITVQTMGSEPQYVYITREDGQYRCLQYSSSSNEVPEEIGWEVLSRLEKHDLAGARKWLDWAREAVHLSENDDPFSGQSFPHFWTKGQEGDAAAIRTAALILLPSKYLTGDNLASLISLREAAKSDTDRNRLTLVLAYAYAAQERWSELVPEAEALVKSSPDSLTAFKFAEQAYAGLKRFDEWQKLVQSRLEKQPDELAYTRSASRLALYRGDVEGAEKIIKPLIENNKAIEEDLNLYAWNALMLPGTLGSDAIEAAERANERSKNANFAILHTLACLYAQSGRETQAKELLLKAMEVAYMEKPDSAIWFGFGKLAEQYGETQDAQLIYGRVEKPKLDTPGSSYALAQARLLALKNATSASTGSAR
jgi:tetratricopeptide (TPR) repeat protein/transglutaminase-like putative cysteine protease